MNFLTMTRIVTKIAAANSCGDIYPKNASPAEIMDEQAAENGASRKSKAGSARPKAHLPHSFGFGKAWLKSASEHGSIIAAPNPWKVRSAIKK
jgi:hypothetical protein